MNAANLRRPPAFALGRNGLEATGLAVILALAALLDTRALHAAASYDEGVFLASLRELDHGAALGSQVFASQPPGFYWLLRAAGLAGSSPTAIRSVFVLLALVGVVAIWWLARSLAGTAAGLVAAGLLALTPGWVAQSSRIEADPPAISLALAALALARSFPFVAGATLAAAISIKLLAVPALVPFALLCGRGLLRASIGAAVAAAAILLPTVSSLGSVWSEAVGFHFAARSASGPSTSQNLQRVVDFPDPRTAAGLLVLLALAYSLLILVARRRLPHWQLWAWTLAAAALLVVQHPLFDHHFVVLAAALAAPAAAATGDALRQVSRPLLVLAAALLLVAAAFGYERNWRETNSATGTPADVSRAAALLEARFPAGSEVASDLEIVPYLAGMRQPPGLVDLSVVRLQAGSISDRTILAESRRCVAFVVGRTLVSRPAVLAALHARYAQTVQLGSLTVYLADR